MFYVKTPNDDIEITDENVFTTCPDCGKEIQVDIQELLKLENADLFGTSVYCERCSAIRENMNMPRLKVIK